MCLYEKPYIQTFNQRVTGSNPVGLTSFFKELADSLTVARREMLLLRLTQEPLLGQKESKSPG